LIIILSTVIIRQLAIVCYCAGHTLARNLVDFPNYQSYYFGMQQEVYPTRLERHEALLQQLRQDGYDRLILWKLFKMDLLDEEDLINLPLTFQSYTENKAE
jgi:hypothetical protein